MSTSELRPANVILGLWPLSGMTTMGVSEDDRDRTMIAAIEAGITAFDSAYSYGLDGISDRLIGRHLSDQREKYFLIGKVGQRYDGEGRRYADGSDQTLRRDAEQSLCRANIDHFDLLMLHQPDPAVPIEKSAETMADLAAAGLAKQIGVCNVDQQQLQSFSRVVSTAAVQCPLNLLQTDRLTKFIPQAADENIDVHVFWTLMKGLLAGRIAEDHVFPPGDSRPGYDIFQGESRRRAHRLVARLKSIADRRDCSIASIAIGWTLAQPGVSAALVGARRPDQIQEIANSTALPSQLLDEIDQPLL